MEESRIIDFTLIYNRYKKPLFNYLAKIVKSEMLAEDIAHDTFVKLYNNFNEIKKIERVEIWIFTTARNEAFGYFRKNGRRKEDSIEFHLEKKRDADLCDEYERRELMEFIEAELDKMEEGQSDVYYLKEYSGLTYKEVARIMDITEDLVRSRLFKVRQKLKNAIIKIY